jgi:hypothetical protein
LGIGLSHYRLYIPAANLTLDSIPQPPTETVSVAVPPAQHLPSQSGIYWYVYAYDSLGNNTYNYSMVNVDIRPPNAFALVSPRNDSIVNIPTPLFSWHASYDPGIGGVRYELWIDSSPNVTHLTDTFSTPSGPLPEGQHRWFVMAIDSFGWSRKSSETRTVILDWNPPDTFSLSSPHDYETTFVQQPRLYWHPSYDGGSGIRKYQLWVNGLVNRDSISASDTSATTAAPLPNGSNNAWFVKAFDRAGGSRSANQTWRVIVFRDSVAPSVPSQITPANGSVGRDTMPLFLWHKSTDDYSGVDHYTLQYAPNPSFTGGVTVNVADTSSQVLVRLADTTWYWHVRAVDRAANQSDWSPTWSFEVDTRTPVIPALLEPIGGAWRNTANIVFRWTAVSFGAKNLRRLVASDAKIRVVPTARPGGDFDSPVRYIMQVDTNRNFLSPLAVDTTGCVQDTIGLAERAKYFWRVRAYDLAGNQGSFSGLDSFGLDRTVPTAPALAAPDSGWVTNNPIVPFVWRRSSDNSSGVRHYTLQYATTSLFISPVTLDSITDTTRSSPSLAESIYYWRVRAVDYAANVGSWSLVWSFRIDMQGPLAPTLVLPADGMMANNASISFVWRRSSSPDASSYTLQFARDSMFTSPDSVRGPDTTAIRSLADTTWYWRVRGNDPAGNAGAWSPKRRFTIDTGVPGTPTLLFPVSGTWLNTSSVAFSWTAVSFLGSLGIRAGNGTVLGAPVRYIIQVDTNHNFLTPLVVDTCLQTRDTLNFGEGRYFWRVRAYDLAGNQGGFLAADSFGVDILPPTIPVLIAPANGSFRNSGMVTFVWHRSSDYTSGVHHYTLQYANNPGFSGAVTRDSVADTSYTVSSALTDTTWYWRLRATDRAGNQCNWSTTWLFEVDSRAPAPPALLEPISGAWVNAPNVVFRWTRVTLGGGPGKLQPTGSRVADSRSGELDSPVSYIIQVDTNRNFVSPLVADTTGFTADTIALAERARYFWRVRAYDAAGNQGSFSSADSFGVDILPPTIPVLVAPANDTTIQDTAVNLVWHRSQDQVSGISNYRVQVALDSGFANLRKDTTLADTSRRFGLPETVYYWRVRATDRAGNRSSWSHFRRFRVRSGVFVAESPWSLPSHTVLGSPVPSPFSGAVVIPYELAAASVVRLAVYDLSGRELAELSNGLLPAGSYQARWNGRTAAGAMLPNGIYVVRLVADGRAQTRKLAMQR